MQSLGGLIAGDPAGAYQQSRKRGQEIEQGDLVLEANATISRGLPFMFNQAAIPGATPIPTVPPGQASQPNQGPGQPQMGVGAFSSSPGGFPLGGGPAPTGAPPTQSGMLSTPTGPGMGIPGGMQIGGPPPPGMGGQPGGQLGGSLTLERAVQGLIRGNPGIQSNPKLLWASLQQMLPLINAQGQQDIRLAIAQLQSRDRVYGIDTRADTAAGAEAGRNWRAQLGADTRMELGRLSRNARMELEQFKQEGRTDLAELSAETRKEIAGMNDVTRRELFGQAEAGRETRSKRHEEGLTARFDWRKNYQQQQLDLAKQRIAASASKEERLREFGRQRLIIDAQHKKAQEQIQSAAAGGMPMDAAERKRLLDEEFAFYNEQIKQLRAATGDSGKGDREPAAPAAPAATEIKLNEQQMKDPDGTRYPGSDGRIYVKRGNMVVPE